MASITLDRLAHSYDPNPKTDADFALKEIDYEWEDGGAYALLGPSGCGKTTLLNIISGLLVPSKGHIKFDGKDVTHLQPEERNIAQVFQFPVIYDTMTVRQNLAFPLLNRRVPRDEITKRVADMIEVLDLADKADRKARGLTADEKQKISLGRGLVRYDVNAILFDEPLTVIDPHMKCQLRTKLKDLHRQLGPAHTFVGYFIGSPGMNVLPCQINGKTAEIGSTKIELAREYNISGSNIELGIRPEFVSLSSDRAGIPVQIDAVENIGRFKIVRANLEGHSINAVLKEGESVPADPTFKFATDRINVYENSHLVRAGG